MAFSHQTVLLEEAVRLLQPEVGKWIVDATLGGGGHSEALLEAGAQVIGIDRDPIALAAATARLSRFGQAFRPVQGRFGEVERLLAGQEVDGLLADLGVSSPQLDEPARGFSFQKDGPLDMRMGSEGPTAAEWISETDERSLAQALFDYGEESFGRAIARELKKARPGTTFEAVEAVKRAVPRKAWPKNIHVATKTFQALRIAVNDELGELESLLASIPRVLRPGGVAAIISFHSLEDRRVKESFRERVGRCTCPPGLPVCACGAKGTFELLTRKAVMAGEVEIEANPRARSARLRAVRRLAG